MKASTRNQAKGRLHEIKDRIKEEAARAMNSPTLQGDGRGEKIAGKIQNRIGKAEKILEK